MAEKEHDDDPGTAAWVPDFDDDSEPIPHIAKPEAEPDPAKEEPEPGEQSESVFVVSGVPVVVPGRYQYVKWWKLLLVILGVWFAAGEVGLSLFYWWYHTVDKTAAVYVALVYVVACVAAAVILAMLQGRPMMSALALAVMSGPFASVAAAAPLYGHYYCERVGHCLIGVIPY